VSKQGIPMKWLVHLTGVHSEQARRQLAQNFSYELPVRHVTVNYGTGV
jgi:hypothetical protein